MIKSSNRVLMTIDSVGGVWSFAMDLCRSMQRCEFLLANLGPAPSVAQHRETDSIGNVRLEVGEYRLEWEQDPWDDLEAAGQWLLSLKNTFEPHLIHLNGYHHAALPWGVPVMVVAHSCVLSWWKSVKLQDAPGEWSRYATGVKRGMDSADMVVVPTHSMGNMLNDVYGATAVRVIPNGADVMRFADPREKEPMILCAGRLWDEAKNVRSLCAIADGLSWPVVVAGDGGEGFSNGNIRFLGRCDRTEMTEWFQRASILAHPALYEPFGLAPLEAAMAGCALVLSDIPSLREVWRDSAVFVDPRNPCAWREAIDGLITDADHRSWLARRARARSARFSSSAMASSYEKAYQQLARRTLSPSS